MYFKPMYKIGPRIILKTYVCMQGPSCSTLTLIVILETEGRKALTLTLETQRRKENHFLKQIVCETPKRH
jgi:hypothetical protein